MYEAAPLSRSYARMSAGEVFFDFVEPGGLGLTLVGHTESATGDKVVALMGVVPESAAARVTSRITQRKFEVGMVLSSVAGTPVRGMAFKQVMGLVKSAGRPFALGFEAAGSGNPDLEELKLVPSHELQSPAMRRRMDKSRSSSESSQPNEIAAGGKRWFEFGGTGSLGLVLAAHGTKTVLSDVAPDSPAAAMPGLTAGLVLATVQEQSVEGWTFSRVMGLLATAGRPIKLEFSASDRPSEELLSPEAVILRQHPEGSVIKAGYLTVCQSGQSHFFVLLSDKFVLYHAVPDGGVSGFGELVMDSGVALNAILEVRCPSEGSGKAQHRQQPGKSVFEIIAKAATADPLRFSAQNAEQRQLWVASLQAAVRAAGGGPSPADLAVSPGRGAQVDDFEFDIGGYFSPRTHARANEAARVQNQKSKRERSKRSEKWQQMHKAGGAAAAGLARRGIPQDVRPKTWVKFSSAEAKRTEAAKEGLVGRGSYSQWRDAGLSARDAASAAGASGSVVTVVKEVEQDLARTFPGHKKFRTATDGKEGEGKQSLRRVLLAYAQRNPEEIGYCQAMNFVAGMLVLLINQPTASDDTEATMSEEGDEDSDASQQHIFKEADAFWVLCAIVEDVLPDYYTRELSGLQRDADVLGQLIEAHQADLDQAMTQLGVYPHDLCVEWFMKLYVTILPLETVMRVWDCLLVDDEEGPTCLLAVAFTILAVNKRDLVKCATAQSFHSKIKECCANTVDADMLIKKSFDKKNLSRVRLARGPEVSKGTGLHNSRKARSVSMATPDRTGSKGDVVQSRSRLQSATVVVPSMDFNLELADEYAMEELGMGAGNGEPEPATAPISKALRFAQENYGFGEPATVGGETGRRLVDHSPMSQEMRTQVRAGQMRYCIVYEGNGSKVWQAPGWFVLRRGLEPFYGPQLELHAGDPLLRLTPSNSSPPPLRTWPLETCILAEKALGMESPPTAFSVVITVADDEDDIGSTREEITLNLDPETAEGKREWLSAWRNLRGGTRARTRSLSWHEGMKEQAPPQTPTPGGGNNGNNGSTPNPYPPLPLISASPFTGWGEQHPMPTPQRRVDSSELGADGPATWASGGSASGVGSKLKLVPSTPANGGTLSAGVGWRSSRLGRQPRPLSISTEPERTQSSAAASSMSDERSWRVLSAVTEAAYDFASYGLDNVQSSSDTTSLEGTTSLSSTIGGATPGQLRRISVVAGELEDANVLKAGAVRIYHQMDDYWESKYFRLVSGAEPWFGAELEILASASDTGIESTIPLEVWHYDLNANGGRGGGERVNNVEFSLKAGNKVSGSEFRLKIADPASIRGTQIVISLVDAESATDLAGWKKAFAEARPNTLSPEPRAQPSAPPPVFGKGWELEGFVSISLGTVRKSWTKRWFALKASEKRLRYFAERPVHMKAKVKGEIDLRLCTLIRRGAPPVGIVSTADTSTATDANTTVTDSAGVELELVMQQDKVHRLRCEDEASCCRWVLAISSVMLGQRPAQGSDWSEVRAATIV